MYVSRVQGAPCEEAKVQLYKGADVPEANKLLNRRQMLLTFLRGKSTEKESLKRNHPEMYKSRSLYEASTRLAACSRT